MSAIRLLLVEDHEMVREGLKLLIAGQADMEVIGEAGDGQTAVRLAVELEPDVVVMDVSMPRLNGMHAAERIRAQRPEARILTLTRHAGAGFLAQLVKAGVAGYVLKQSAPSELLRGIRAVAAGGNYLDPAVTGAVMDRFARAHPFGDQPGQAEPTERESEVLRHIALGYSNKEIAAALGVSVKTVEAHKSNAMRKMGMRSRIDIVRFAILRGWLADT